jgi:hypothetical protein
MTRSLVPPRNDEQISRTKSRVNDLERRLARPVRTPLGYIAKFSLHGGLYVSTSGVDAHPTGGRLVNVYGYLDTAGTTTTVVSLLKNGISFGLLKFPSGVVYNELVVSLDFSARKDEFQVSITSVGSGARSLSVFGQFDH